MLLSFTISIHLGLWHFLTRTKNKNKYSVPIIGGHCLDVCIEATLMVPDCDGWEEVSSWMATFFLGLGAPSSTLFLFFSFEPAIVSSADKLENLSFVDLS